MNSSLFRKQQLKYLAALLGVDKRILEYAINNAEKLYREWEELKIDKRTRLPKLKNGVPQMRPLREAVEPLKTIQSRISKRILSNVPIADCAYGSVKKKSNITNAKRHQGNKYLFTTDLCDFYNTLGSEKVYFFFRRHGYSEHIAKWLTRLTTKNYCIPQGASTSSYLQNLVFKPYDNMIQLFCKQNEITYTRFVDDLTFSSPTCIKAHVPYLLRLVMQSGCRINNQKTAYSNKVFVTGIKVKNNYIDIDDYLKEYARKEKEALNEDGPYFKYWKRVIATNKNCEKSRF